MANPLRKAGAFTSDLPPHMTHIVFAQIGIQSKENNEPTTYLNTIKETFSLTDGPKHVDRSVFYDRAGYTNHLFLVYWDNVQAYETWLNHSEVREWWSGKFIEQESPFGFFSEVATIPMTHFETIYSKKNEDSGISHFTPVQHTNVNGYWGAMRDRMSATISSSDFQSTMKENLTMNHEKETFGKRLKVIAPDNVCLIRTAQDWTKCSEEEKKTYEEQVAPKLEEANTFLSNHSEETGCISSKLVHEMDADGNRVDKSCVIGFFTSLEHLEQWTHKHRTHQAIYKAFFQMIQTHNFSIQLHLWHEVSVLQSKDLQLEYVNCHPDTGFIPYFDTIEIE